MALHPSSLHRPNPFALLGLVTVTFAAVVWWLSTMHFDNAVLDALPASASLARDVTVAFVVLLWMPVLVIALVTGAALCFTMAGRNALEHRAAVAPQPRPATLPIRSR